MHPKSGQAKSPVLPTEPQEALEAANAKPGEIEKLRKVGSAESALAPHRLDPAKKSWIEIKLVDEANQPVTGEPYRIILPDGESIAEGTLDEVGFARVDGIDSGTCQVAFPNLNEDAWQRA